MQDLALTLSQILVIVLCARGMGILLKRLGQPSVIGEIAAGILLGPSAFGRLAPDAFARLFPQGSLPPLIVLSQIGLILFMFMVGLEFAPKVVSERKHVVVVISHVSIIVPFLLGTALAFYLYPRVSDPGVSFRSFVLFLGIAMSITAFPVLARILEERHLLRTQMGSTAIGCAAVDDVTAWCLLAFVVMTVRSSDPSQLVLQLSLVVVFVIIMIFGVRRFLTPKISIAAALFLAFASAWITEFLGIHALFGAFLTGAILPRDAALRKRLSGHLREVTSILFLPLLFAVTGLRTNVGLLQSAELWICCALVVLVAIAGKFGGATLSAKAVGFCWRDAMAIGVLMNTRGLMEIVVLNIGLEIGVVSRALFTMCVIMALVTTAMTAPLLDPIVWSAAAKLSLPPRENT